VEPRGEADSVTKLVKVATDGDAEGLSDEEWIEEKLPRASFAENEGAALRDTELLEQPEADTESLAETLPVPDAESLTLAVYDTDAV